MSIVGKLRRLRSYWFQVPWCVPPWGWKEFRTAAGCVLRGAVVHGRDGERFESRVREVVGRRFAIPVGRGRDALWLALRALELGPEDEVVMPAYVCASVPEAVRMAGARPVWADVNDRLVVTLDAIRAAMTPRTRCAIVPHLFGNAAEVEAIEPFLQARGVALIDDAAQAFGMRRAGRPLGSFGQFGVVCGGPGKPLVTPAGGVLLMDDPELYRRAAGIPLAPARAGHAVRRVLGFWFWRRWRRYTVVLEAVQEWLWPPTEASPPPGAPANLDAALLCRQLESYEANGRRRQVRAARLRALLDPLHWREVSDAAQDAAPLKLVLLLPEEGPAMAEALGAFAAAGVECQPGYTPCHLKEKCEDPHPLPFTDRTWARVLCVPLDTDVRNPRRLERLAACRRGAGAVPERDAADTHSR